MFVYQAMSRLAHTVRPEDPAGEAYRRMQEAESEALPVTDRHGNLLGIVALSDLLRDLAGRPAPDYWETRRVEDVFVRDVQTVDADEIIEEAAFIMRRRGFSALPVVDRQGHLVGILTERDLYRVFEQMLGLHEPGTRVTVLVEDRVGVVADLAGIVRRCGVSLSSLVTFPGEGKAATVVLRLRTREAQPVVDALVAAGYRVLHVSQVWEP